MKHILSFISTLIFFNLLIPGCTDYYTEKSPHGPDEYQVEPVKHEKIKHFNLSRAKILLVTDEFLKIKSDGSIGPVIMKNENDEIINGIVPERIHNCSYKYFMIYIDTNLYLVNKVTGEAQNINQAGLPDMGTQTGLSGTKRFYLDSEGNIYYLSYDAVVKIDVISSNETKITDITTRDEPKFEFAVDGASNVMYSRKENREGKFKPVRIQCANGTLTNTASENKGFFTGLDKKLYCNYLHVPRQYYKGTYIYRIDIDNNGNASYSPYGNTNTTVTGKGKILYFRDSIYDVDCTTGHIHEINTKCGSLRPSTRLPFLENGVILKQSHYYIYLLKNDNSIIKINPQDYSYTVVLKPGLYEISQFEAAGNEMIIFLGNDVKTGNFLLGNISADGALSNITSISFFSINLFVKIN